MSRALAAATVALAVLGGSSGAAESNGGASRRVRAPRGPQGRGNSARARPASPPAFSWESLRRVGGGKPASGDRRAAPAWAARCRPSLPPSSPPALASAQVAAPSPAVALPAVLIPSLAERAAAPAPATRLGALGGLPAAYVGDLPTSGPYAFPNPKNKVKKEAVPLTPVSGAPAVLSQPTIREVPPTAGLAVPAYVKPGVAPQPVQLVRKTLLPAYNVEMPGLSVLLPEKRAPAAPVSGAVSGAPLTKKENIMAALG